MESYETEKKGYYANTGQGCVQTPNLLPGGPACSGSLTAQLQRRRQLLLDKLQAVESGLAEMSQNPEVEALDRRMEQRSRLKRLAFQKV